MTAHWCMRWTATHSQLGRRINFPTNRGSCYRAKYDSEQEVTEAKQETAQAKRKAERLRQLGVNPDQLDELL
ncbi:hypothetical protein [Nostoc sp.]|uniref:hypothetical protein n=1 Tax=Nostoc sp. TaxID=1180 RepID=UPI002FF83338